jgi:TolB-like protein/DNA-binding winged helix-turn-helix (wHTH) protein
MKSDSTGRAYGAEVFFQKESAMIADFLLGEWAAFISLNSLVRGSETIHIEPKMMQVLALLVQYTGKVISREEIQSKVWPNTFVTDQSLYRCISELRKILGDDERSPHFIQTVAKGGYRLMDPPTQPKICSCTRLRQLGLAVPGSVIGSIAVLPFADMTEEKDMEYFCESIAEDIINSLSHIKGLNVASRSSSFHFRSKAEDARTIGEKLNVCAVIEGSVQREDKCVRIAVQLICVVDDYQIRSEQYTFSGDGHFAIQDEVSRAVADKLSECSGRSRPAPKP